MAPTTIGLLSIAAVMLLIAIRVPIAVSLFSVSIAGIWAILGERPALGLLSTVPYSFAASWTLSSVPMFLLMGFMAFYSGMTRGLFDAGRAWLGRLPGGLAIASVFGASGFAAVTGSSVACCAAIGRIAVPEMRRSGYDLGLATGSVAAAGTIGALIPPSIILILFGIQAQVSINALFIGGAVIGVVSLVGYSLVILVTATRSPALAPRGPVTTWSEKVTALWAIWPTILLVVLVFGGLFSGVFTATEAGAVGALFTAIIGIARRTLTRELFFKSCWDTLLSSGSLFMIAVAANAFTRLVALSGLSAEIGAWIGGMDISTTAILFIVALIYLVLGMFLEPIGAMLLTLPLMLPILQVEGIGLIWFGVFLAKILEVGMITPPVGLNVFVIHSVARDFVKLEKIFYGVMRFIVADLVILTVMILTWSYF